MTANTTESDDLPLQGLTVLDLSQGIAGPHCGLLLRQHGARVIKVEPPTGDWSRQMGRSRGGHTAISIAYNLGKESVVIDSRTAGGRQALRQLAAQADVVVQNYRPGVVERMGVAYADLAAAKPSLVYVSVSGYGLTGPEAALPALDTTMQAATGLMHLNRGPDGAPRRIPLFLVDITTGLQAAQNAMAALVRAARTGRGRHVQVSMLETCTALQSYLLLDEAMFPDAQAAAFNVPTGLFPAADGYLYVSMLDDAMFLRLAKALDFVDWQQDAQLHHSAGRIARAADMNKRVGALVATQTVAHWETLLRAHDVLCARAVPACALHANAQAQHAGVFSTLREEGLGELPWPNVPGLAGRTPQGRAPCLGQHTQAVAAEFRLESLGDQEAGAGLRS